MDELDELRQLWARLDSGEEEAAALADQRRALAEESDQLFAAAYEAYKLRQWDSAISLFHRAYQAAVRAEDQRRQAKQLHWEGHTLRRAGRLREALACLLAAEGLEQADKAVYWNGLIDQIGIAISLPLSLEKLQSLMDRCRDEMGRLGLNASRGMLLIEESDLAYQRHDNRTELAKAQEAMAGYDASASPDYNISTYYYMLIWALLDVKDRPNAQRWLERYEGAVTQHEVHKELNLLGLRRHIALKDGDLPAAWSYAQRALQKAREGQRNPFVQLQNCTDTAIQCGHLREAAAGLAELLTVHRHSESGHRRYSVRRLAGDYHRAVARRCADKAVGFTAAARRHTALAQRYYGYADRVGRFLDEKLCCDWRQQEIRERLASLQEQ